MLLFPMHLALKDHPENMNDLPPIFTSNPKMLQLLNLQEKNMINLLENELNGRWTFYI